MLRFSLERNFEKTNLISSKRTPQNNPGLLGLIRKLSKRVKEGLKFHKWTNSKGLHDGHNNAQLRFS